MNFNFLFLLGALFLEQPAGCSGSTDKITLNDLFEACYTAKPARLEKLLSDARLESFDGAIDQSNASPLQILVEKVAKYAESDVPRAKGLAAVIDSLVAKGVDLERVNDAGWTALTAAVFLASVDPAYPLAVIASLLPKGKKCPAINTATRSFTPLHFAAASKLPGGRALELVRLLIDNCSAVINFDARDSNNWTPLKTATVAGNADAKELLYSKAPFFTTARLVITVAVIAVLALVAAAAYFYYAKFAGKKEKEKNDSADSADSADSETEEAKEPEAEGSANGSYESTDDPAIESIAADKSDSSLTLTERKIADEE